MKWIKPGRVLFRVALLLLMTGSNGGGISKAFGQDRDEAQLLRMNNVIATAGQEVKLHLVMGPVPDSVRRLELELEVPPGQVSFTGFEPVYLAEKAGLQFSVLERNSERVRFAFTLPESQEARFPEEGLGFLLVKVLDETQPQVLVVKVVEVDLIDSGGEVVKSTSGGEGVVNVVSDELYPLVNCFYYMH